MEYTLAALGGLVVLVSCIFTFLPQKYKCDYEEWRNNKRLNP